MLNADEKKLTMKLEFFLAKSAILHFFHYRYWTKEELHSLQHLFSSDGSDRIWKMQLRFLCQENNDMIVAAVLADASPEEEIFLYDKFYKQDSFVKIGMKLHIHPNGLQRWRDKFLLEISSLMNYHLPVSSMFSRNKIEVMICCLERIISLIEPYGRYDISFMNGLKAKLNGYQNLLFVIKQIMNSDSEHIGIQIVRLKILNPNISCDELGKRLRISHTTVTKYIQYFQQNFYPFSISDNITSSLKIKNNDKRNKGSTCLENNAELLV